MMQRMIRSGHIESLHVAGRLRQVAQYVKRSETQHEKPHSTPGSALHPIALVIATTLREQNAKISPF
jgi:hypothetical protein